MAIPQPESLDRYSLHLAQMVGKTSWLPNRSVVKKLDEAIFPTSRSGSGHKRFHRIKENKRVIGMYDDNTTPAWAIFWSHGLKGTRPKGWTIAHVWPNSNDIKTYTHLANLAMVPEPFAGLTDKNGPLTGFLRWHAWHVYAWKPAREAKPRKPDGYDEVEWRYLTTDVSNPKSFIRDRIKSLDNERIRILQPIMKRLHML
ncbi:MAG: hypothetical protein KC643_26485 [Nitrospira sp.]|nr:hypothetical protein [Nitrospira sp.]